MLLGIGVICHRLFGSLRVGRHLKVCFAFEYFIPKAILLKTVQHLGVN
jgi:hypothetical protein